MAVLPFSLRRRSRQEVRLEAPAIAPSMPLPEISSYGLPAEIQAWFPQPAPDSGSAAYPSSLQHLRDALARVDLLVRAQVMRWGASIAQHKPQQLWGMLHVSHGEAAAYLASSPDGTQAFEERSGASRLLEWAAHYGDRTRRRMELTAFEPQLARLIRLFDLSEFDTDLLLTCLLPEVDGRFRRIYGYLQDDASRGQPSVELLLQVVQPAHSMPDLGLSAFQPHSPLIAHGLLELSGDGPLAQRRVLVNQRIASFLHDGDGIDGRLAPYVHEAQPLAWEALLAEDELVARLHALVSGFPGFATRQAGAGILLWGARGSGRLDAARAMCSACNLPLLVVDVKSALRGGLAWSLICELAYREALLRDAALYWEGCEALLERPETPEWSDLSLKADRAPTLTFFASETLWEPGGCFTETPFLRLEFVVPSYRQRVILWTAYLARSTDLESKESAGLPEALASAFRLNQGQIVDALASGRSMALLRNPAVPRLTPADIFEGCRRQSSRQLNTFGRRIEPRTDLTFEDLILPEPNRRQLEELRARIRHRGRLTTAGFERRVSLGRGLVTLFTGSSGTGKTMAAELLAREQGVDLFKVDLSTVVSKWVGETEKNLGGIFNEAESANAIIFFDEADSLFGKRGEVRESQDRWANMEVNYLLQRVEEYSGVVILASNLRQNIDEAFLRRIQVLVEFPSPDADARLRILKGLFPPGIETPPEADLVQLAERLKLGGGSLKNIVLDAAYRALSEQDGHAPCIETRHLVAAAAREYQKLGRPITRGDFGNEFYAYVQESVL